MVTIAKKGNACFLIRYKIYAGQCIIINYGIHLNGDESVCFERVEIPEIINGRPVTKIENGNYSLEFKTILDASKGKERLATSDYKKSIVKELVLPRTISSIQKGAFAKSLYVEGIVWPDSCKTIPDSCFCQSKIQRIYIPEGIESIGTEAFYESELREVNVPKSCHTINIRAFSYCKSLKTINITDKTSVIRLQAFQGSGIETFFWPANCDILPKYVFEDCEKLRALIVRGSLIRINNDFIKNCPNIETLDLSNITVICKAKMDFYDTLAKIPNVILPKRGIIIEDDWGID